MNWTKNYKKAVTFSYDDGVTPDLRLLEVFNRYGMKCTFNLNSGLGKDSGSWECNGKKVSRLELSEHVKDYAGHEIAAHALTHADLVKVGPVVAKTEMQQDMDGLEKIFGVRPVGMAYPFGTFDDATVEVLRGLGLQYGRTVWSSHNFDVQTDLLRFRPTCHHDDEKLFELAERFLTMDTEEPQIFYVWGHSYEFMGNDNWDRMERLCQMLSGRDDIFYGTNKDVLL